MIDNTLIKALARALRWKHILAAGAFTTINELAEHEGIAPSCLTRIIRLTLLAPDIVEAIRDGRQGQEVTLARLLKGFFPEWMGSMMDSAGSCRYSCSVRLAEHGPSVTVTRSSP